MPSAIAGPMGSGSLPGSATNWSAAYGGAPNVPNPATSAGSAISGNMGNLGQIYNLAGSANAFNTQQEKNILASMIPNYAALSGSQSGLIGEELKGQVPQDVISEILQGAAERGIATGTSGSPNANAAYLRALGLTSLGLQQQGVSNLATFIGETPMPQPFNIQSMMVSPEAMQQAQMEANVMASAPVPEAASRAAQSAALSGITKGASMVPSGATIARTPYGGLPAPGINAGPMFASDAMIDSGPVGALNVDTYDPYQSWQQWASNVPTSTGSSGSGNWYYDSAIGGYVNSLTGQISDTAGGTPWQGFSYEGTMAAAEDPYADAAYMTPAT